MQLRRQYDALPSESLTADAESPLAAQLAANLITQQVTRRTMLRKLFMGMGAVSTPSLLAACSGSSVSPNPAQPPVGQQPPADPPPDDTPADPPAEEPMDPPVEPPPEPPAPGPELDLPSGPLADIPPVEKKTMIGGAIDGVDEELFAPPGFDVRVVARRGLNPVTGLPDPEGYEWHKDPDGGAVYPSAADGGWVYVSNSEETPGGVGAIRFDAVGNIIDAYSILGEHQVNGPNFPFASNVRPRNNCAGGATPWGTWLSCEETGGGEVYECDPFKPFTGAADANVKPALGQFPHEAAAIDPIHHACYLTEDGGSNRFWRFVSDADDLVTEADGSTRMKLESGKLQIMEIEGFGDGGYPSNEQLRHAAKVNWIDGPIPVEVPGSGQRTPMQTNIGTRIAQGEGLWYYEVPEGLSSTPLLGTVPTRGVMFFASKGDNRVYAYDIENELVEIIYDNDNMQQEIGFDQVDNVVVSPAGDVLVAEDGALMRLIVVVPNGESKLLMQIKKGGSEITGPAFTPDGSRLYFSSQRGPSGADGTDNGGATYEITIPPEYRARAA